MSVHSETFKDSKLTARRGWNRALLAVAIGVLSLAAISSLAAEEKALSIDLGEGVKMEFVRIPAGSFLMGSEQGRPHEKPIHKVTITMPFYLGKFEITQEQWLSLMGTNRSHYQGTNLPLENVSWNDCQELIAKLNKSAREYEFHLPTEAQWEYACRAGTTNQYSFGDTDAALPEHGWFTGNGERKTHPVGQKKPNPWGLHDIHGNVWEWCQDWHGPYSAEDATNPSGPTTGTNRVIRGGSWSHPSRDLTSSFRLQFKPDFRFRSIGARLAATKKEK